MGKNKIEKQFLSAYDEYAASILRHIYYRVSENRIAEDLTQETFLKAWRYLAEGKKVESLKTFLYRIADNLVIDFYRNKARLNISLDELPVKDLIKKPEQVQLVEQILQRKIINNLLNQLDADSRRAVIYRYIDNLSIKEIGEIIGKTPNHISVIIHRSLKILKNKSDVGKI